MTATLAETAYAKINLALHVRGRRTDGYHRLETLFAFAGDGDRLQATPADAITLTVSGRFAAALGGDDPADNLVLRAARDLAAAFGIGAGAALRLDKRLPVASGIGGGSADAAAALRLLARLWGVPVDDPRVSEIAMRLGADVPACLSSRTVRGEEKGDVLLPVAGGDLSGMALLLVNPAVALSTAAVFRAWSGRDAGALAIGEPLAVAVAGRNDLQPPALSIVPVIAAVLAELEHAGGVRLARMSGSGATCFALFDGDAARDAAAAAIGARHPEWWTMASRLR